MQTKPRYQARLFNRGYSCNVGDYTYLENINNPHFTPVQLIFTSKIIRVDRIGYYIVEVETTNTIYEIVE